MLVTTTSKWVEKHFGFPKERCETENWKKNYEKNDDGYKN